MRKVESGETIDMPDYKKVTLGLLCNMSSSLGGFSKELSDVKNLAQSNLARGESNEDCIKQLEAKVGLKRVLDLAEPHHAKCEQNVQSHGPGDGKGSYPNHQCS